MSKPTIDRSELTNEICQSSTSNPPAKHTCELCGKYFKQKSGYTQHRNRKQACVPPIAVVEPVLTTDIFETGAHSFIEVCAGGGGLSSGVNLHWYNLSCLVFSVSKISNAVTFVTLRVSMLRLTLYVIMCF